MELLRFVIDDRFEARICVEKALRMILGRVEKLAADHLPEPLLLMARRSVRELFLALSL